MFTSKKTTLFETPKKKTALKASSEITPIFVAKAMRKAVETKSGNGALKLSSTLNDFVDQFSKLGTYKAPRSFNEVEKDCETLWANNKLDTVKFMGYLRTVTRR
jgi:hypothetical protein